MNSLEERNIRLRKSVLDWMEREDRPQSWIARKVDIFPCLVTQWLKQERELLRPARDQADYIIDTSLLSAAQLKEQVAALFLKEKKEKMLITCTSFGFKYGIPSDADLVFDVRCLPNPFYIPELKYKTGLDQQVRDYVFSHEQAQQLYRKIEDLLKFTIPLYEKEGKRQLVVAFGCTGGKHRSVSFAWRTAQVLKAQEENVFVSHRDVRKA